MEPVLKTGGQRCLVGSNPTPSATGAFRNLRRRGFEPATTEARPSVCRGGRHHRGPATGYYGSGIDVATTWRSGVLQALAGFIVLSTARAKLGPSIWTSVRVLRGFSSAVFRRVVDSAVTAVHVELCIEADRKTGMTNASSRAASSYTAVSRPTGNVWPRSTRGR